MKNEKMFLVRRKVLESLRADQEWGQRLEEAKTTEEVIIIQFCHAKGLKVKNVG